ncbi:MAG: hypothetical protein M3178_10105 [Pseudomonadota bacterium]|nr:hypothetical protein [Pseudomonadota bacterium]
MTMTTKPKRKAPPVKRAAPKAAPKQASDEPKREVSGIRRFVSRWHWLEADQKHRSNIVQTKKESERLIAIHNDEQGEIESVLAQVVPGSFLDACYLLEFVIGRVGQGSCMFDHAEIAMLKNVREGLRLAWGGEIKAARNDGMEEMRRTINFMTANASKMIDAELDIPEVSVTIRLRYHTFKLRALIWVLRRLRAADYRSI